VVHVCFQGNAWTKGKVLFAVCQKGLQTGLNQTVATLVQSPAERALLSLIVITLSVQVNTNKQHNGETYLLLPPLHSSTSTIFLVFPRTKHIQKALRLLSWGLQRKLSDGGQAHKIFLSYPQHGAGQELGMKLVKVIAGHIITMKMPTSHAILVLPPRFWRWRGGYCHDPSQIIMILPECPPLTTRV
jgi:hypothetical protein